MPTNRRTFCATSAASLLAFLAAQESHAAEVGKPLDSFAKPFDSLTPKSTGSNTFRAICDGTTAVGARVEIHETTLAPGAEPHPAHRHKHEEFLLMVKGQVEITVDGQSSTLGPGGCGFWKSMSLHHARNTGTEPAQYFIVSVGND